MFKITNKIKKYFGGNWGKPKGIEHDIKIPLDYFDDKEPKWQSAKKKQSQPKKTAYWDECPFCLQKLVELPEGKERSIFRDYLPECACGAIQVPDCPACHHNTWMKDGIYKHKWLGCGFTGRRLAHHEGG